MKIHKIIKKFIYPTFCPMCENIITNDDYICNNCINIPKTKQNLHCKKCSCPISEENEKIRLCVDCFSKKSFFDKNISYYDYEFLKYGIYNFKYDDKPYLAEVFAKLIYDNIVVDTENFEIFNSATPQTAFLPIPMSKQKIAKRGYNQANLLADELSKLTNIKTRKDVLVRLKNTTPQYKLSHHERQNNIKGAFGVNKDILETLNISKVIIVDDIFTSGSTINECAKILKQNGFEEVYSLTLTVTKKF